MELPLKTKEVVKSTGISYSRIMCAIRDGRLEPPRKDSSGDYVWSPEDIERARALVKSKPAPEEVAEEPQE